MDLDGRSCEMNMISDLEKYEYDDNQICSIFESHPEEIFNFQTENTNYATFFLNETKTPFYFEKDSYSDEKQQYILDNNEGISTGEKTKKSEAEGFELTNGDSQNCATSKTIEPTQVNHDINSWINDPFKTLKEDSCFNSLSVSLEEYFEAKTNLLNSTITETTKSNEIFTKELDSKPTVISKLVSSPKQKQIIFSCTKIMDIDDNDVIDLLNTKSVLEIYPLLNFFLRKKNKLSLGLKLKKDNNGKPVRKVDNDSIYKKIKTDSLNFLLSKTKINNIDFFKDEKKDCTIQRNKVFNKMSLKTIFRNELEEHHKIDQQNSLDKIEKRLDLLGYIDYTFEDFFRKVYLDSEHFKNLSRKNAKDIDYLGILINKAYDYIGYFEREKALTKKKKKKNNNKKLNKY